jgi:Rrf2 family protein
MPRFFRRNVDPDGIPDFFGFPRPVAHPNCDVPIERRFCALGEATRASRFRLSLLRLHRPSSAAAGSGTMKLSRTSVYAIGATLQLANAEPRRPISCKFLADNGSTPPRFLLHILRTLVERGILESARGVDGGFFLARPPEKVSLLDIVDVFDKSRSSIVPDVARMGPAVRARLSEILREANNFERNALQTLTLADLMAVQNKASLPKGLGAVARLTTKIITSTNVTLQ